MQLFTTRLIYIYLFRLERRQFLDISLIYRELIAMRQI